MITFFLQSPFRNVSYDLIGDDAAASYFRVDPTSGAISITNNLATDPTREFKLRVRASDGGQPPKSNVTVVSVEIVRNIQAPRFELSRYTVEVLETLEVGETIGTVEATDSDLRVRE